MRSQDKLRPLTGHTQYKLGKLRRTLQAPSDHWPLERRITRVDQREVTLVKGRWPPELDETNSEG